MKKRLTTLVALLIALPAAASITGVVINSDGQAIAGAKVSLFAPETIAAHRLRLVSDKPERPAIASMTTDSKGTFNFESPKDQRVVDVGIEATGYAPDTLRLLAEDDAGAVALIAAPMQRGTITASGKPVAGATVVWFGNSSDFLAKTDAQGHYSVPDPSKWANRLIIIHPDYAVVDDTTVFRTTPKLDHALSAGVPVTGRVLAEDGKTAVGKAPVMLDDLPLATTGDDGSFTIAHAPANWQELQTVSGNLAGVRARTAASAINVRMAKSAKITGVIRDAKSQLPLASAEIRIGSATQFAGRMRGFGGGANNGPATESVLTDAKGNFAVIVPAGRYTISAIYPGSSIAQMQVSVTAGQTISKALYASARARVSGVVLDEDRRPVAGTRLTVDASRRGPMMMVNPGRLQQGMAGYSGPDGRFILRDVMTDSEVELAALKKGLPIARSAPLKLSSGERKSGVTITIPRGVGFSGRVIDANGRPVSGVAVEPAEAQVAMRGAMVRRIVNLMTRDRDDDLVRTGSDGAFTVRVKPGTYDVVFRRDGFATKVLRGEAIDASTKPVEVKLDPSVEISGRVVRNGAGIEGVNVNAIGQDATAMAITGPDGSFTLTDLSPGQMMLNVMKPDSFIQQMRPVNAPARDVVIELPNGGRISGRVVDKSTHNPVTSFQAGVSVNRSAGGMVIVLPPMLKSFTSDDGTFTLENVPPGPTELQVNAPGYTSGKVPGLNIQDGKAIDNIEVSLDTGVRLAGRVTGPDGSPLSGVSVREADPNSGPARFFAGGAAGASTDANGEYTIEAVEPGDKTFTFTLPGYLSTDKSITLSGRDARLDVQLSAGMSVTGSVVTDSGAPVPDANVNAMSATNSMFGNPSARTDANGSFEMTGLAPGHYNFVARKEGLTQGTLRDFDISTGAPPRIVMAAGGTIIGHVTGLTDAELQNATVFANSANGNASADVDSSGAYRIDGAPIGTVHVMARTNRGMGGGGKSSGPVSVQVDAGSVATADIQFKSSTIVQGRVTRNGQPMANVMVSFNPRSGASTSSSGTTDSNGSYQISGLDDGNYSVGVIDIDRSNAFSSQYEVHGSGTFDIDIKTASLRGTVVDSSTGEPLSDVQIQLQSGQGFLGSRAAVTDPSGAFFIDNVARGSYHVVAQKDGYGHDMRDIVIGDSTPDDLQFKLSPSGGVTITVVDARDNRQLSANAIRVIDASGKVVEAGGAFRFGGGPEPIKLTLAPGSYTVTIAAMGYANKIVTVTSPSQITVALTPGATLVLRSKSSTPQRARLIDSSGAIYRTVNVDPSPLTTTINNVAGGSYTLQVLDSSGAVINTIPVTIVDGQQMTIDV